MTSDQIQAAVLMAHKKILECEIKGLNHFVMNTDCIVKSKVNQYTIDGINELLNPPQKTKKK